MSPLSFALTSSSGMSSTRDTFGKGLLSTLQIGAEQALAHGYAPFFTATG
jgi:hypothetical protein